jgi:nitrate/TMAO reductase-like tetraheme cytochrome c subunit
MNDETENSENTEPKETDAPVGDAVGPKPRQPSLLRNYVSFIGMAIVAACVTSIALLIMVELTSPRENPYTVLVTYILLPSVMGFGIFVILVGMFIERRRRRKNPGSQLPAYPILDLNDTSRRRKFLAVMVMLFIFLFVSAFGSYRAFEYTESVAFCGTQCHTVMQPEYVAYKASPHSNIRCVECHVGGGADAYVKAKLNGMHQLYAVTFHTYNRPIETPVKNMRPANETCGACHWPEKFYGQQLKTFNHYGYDEKNSLNQTRLLINVGGGSPTTGEVGGIHWHMNIANEVTYIAADDKRQDIPWVRFRDKDGKVTEYMARGASMSESLVESMEKRRMDCIDCHNRPTHIYLTPNQAVDQALNAGRLDPALPYIKAQAVEALSGQYSTSDEAQAAIAAKISEYYRQTYPDIAASRADAVNAAITETQSLYRTYFFPEMNTNWSSHRNNIGHLIGQGCFRCHDGQHVSKEGQVIRNDCNICHTTVDQTFAGQRRQPADGMFQHPVNIGDKNTYQCAMCHKGDRPFRHPLNLGDISQFKCADCHSGTYEKVRF